MIKPGDTVEIYVHAPDDKATEDPRRSEVFAVEGDVVTLTYEFSTTGYRDESQTARGVQFSLSTGRRVTDPGSSFPIEVWRMRI